MNIKINYKCDIPNLNGRIYPSGMMRDAIELFKDQPLQPVCMSIHDFDGGTVDMSKIAAKVVKLDINSDGEFDIDINILDTPMGKILKQMSNDPLILTTAGIGGVEDNIINNFALIGFAVTDE